MKSTIYLTIFSLSFQLSRCEVAPYFDLQTRMSNQIPNDVLDLANGNFSDAGERLGSHGALARRQIRCEDPGYLPCPNVPGKCCPASYTCFPIGCCPIGEQPCGSRYCYNPSTEQCCANGSCSKAYKCCERSCCRSIAYCAADGNCSVCPAATTTVTTTSDYTYTSTTTRTITEVTEPEEPPGFSCPPLTVTNGEGWTLELDTECALSFTPPEPSENANADAAAPNLPRDTSGTRTPQLHPRQESCEAFRTFTDTLTITRTVTSRATRTTTTSTEPEGFSCVPVSVTNEFGDELALDDKCQLEFSPADPTSTPSGQQPAAPGPTSTSSGQLSAAPRLESFAISLCGAVIVSVVAHLGY